MTRYALAVVVVAVSAGVVGAQPEPAPMPAPTPPVAVPSPAPAPAPAAERVGPRWTSWRLQAVEPLLEPPTTVRALLEPTMAQHTVIDDAADTAIREAALSIGYHVIGVGVADHVATVSLAPVPIVRSVVVSDDQGFTDMVLNGSFEEQIQRRLRVRTGARLPWDPDERKDALLEEGKRIEEYLQEEGYFEAKALLSGALVGRYGIRVTVDITLGPPYKVGLVQVETGGGQGVSVGEIKGLFTEQLECLVWQICIGTARFTRARHNSAIEKAYDLYHKRGFPAARVQSDYDRKTSFDRKSKTVRFTVRIDERRQIDVVFEGNNKARFADDQLKKQLTFDAAGSADDFEAATSAAALVAYYQGRGRFDTQVTWTRERFPAFDRIVFRIDEGSARQVRSVTFRGNREVPASVLAGAITTRVYRTIRVFESNPSATAQVLVDDADKIRRAYARRGYLATRVDVRAAPDRDALDSPAITGVTLASGRKPSDLHVRFDVVEGPRTDLAEIQLVTVADPERGGEPERLSETVCTAALEVLREKMGAEATARRAIPGGCAATVTPIPFKEETLQSAGDGLRDWFWQDGRPRTGVELQIDPNSLAQQRAVLRYRVTLGPRRELGKVIIRGNFRTRRSVIVGELGFDEGDAVTSTMLAQGPRAVRATGLFEAVNVELLNLDADATTPVDAVVRVEERYDARLQVDTELGYSTRNGLFARAKGALPNLWGSGIYTDLALAYGFDVNGLDLSEWTRQYSAIELSGRIPHWLADRAFPVAFDTEITGYLREQDTERFGMLATRGASIGMTRSWQRPGTATRRPSTIAASLRYDLRQRNRDEEAIRIAGVDADQEKVPVPTRTGSIGVGLRYDSRVDYRGQYNPLAAEAGLLLDATVSLASPYLFGQDTFIKASAMVQKFWPIGKRGVIRTDIRVDEGFPLGGSVLLPEVERFFAGGDNTVRGFDEDRLATEIIETMVPPIDGLEQIRILPAGGNIRAVGSIDAQLLLRERWLATALFIDAGMVRNRWAGIEASDIRPGVGSALRVLTPFGTITVEYAFPLFPRLGDDPRGRFHFGLAFRQ